MIYLERMNEKNEKRFYKVMIANIFWTAIQLIFMTVAYKHSSKVYRQKGNGFKKVISNKNWTKNNSMFFQIQQKQSKIVMTL